MKQRHIYSTICFAFLLLNINAEAIKKTTDKDTNTKKSVILENNAIQKLEELLPYFDDQLTPSGEEDRGENKKDPNSNLEEILSSINENDERESQWLRGRFGREAEQWLRGRFGREAEQWLRGRFGREMGQWLRGRFGRNSESDQWLRGRFGDSKKEQLRGRFGDGPTRGRFGKKDEVEEEERFEREAEQWLRGRFGRESEQWLRGRFGREAEQWLRGRFGRDAEQWLRGRFGKDSASTNAVENMSKKSVEKSSISEGKSIK